MHGPSLINGGQVCPPKRSLKLKINLTGAFLIPVYKKAEDNSLQSVLYLGMDPPMASLRRSIAPLLVDNNMATCRDLAATIANTRPRKGLHANLAEAASKVWERQLGSFDVPKDCSYSIALFFVLKAYKFNNCFERSWLAIWNASDTVKRTHCN